MVPGGITELVWHFIAHLRITDDIARDRTAYEGPALPKPLDDYKTPRPDFDRDHDLDAFDTTPIGPPVIRLLDDHILSKLPQVRSQGIPIDDDLDLPTRLPATPIFRPGAGGGGGGSDHEIKVIHEPGGEQGQIQIRQLNGMLDNDISLQGSFGSGDTGVLSAQAAQISAQAASLLQHMADDANGQIPSQWWIPQNGAGVTAFVQDFDNGQVAHDGTVNANSVVPGYYLNGELQTPAPEPPSPELGRPADPDTGNGLGLWAEAGGNVSFNGAMIVDLSESGRSMIVKGDYFHTNAIFQTNSLMDEDQIAASQAEDGSMTAGDDITDNIADFIQHPGVYSLMPATYAGPNWHVDVVNGDYYNVQTLVQMNYLLDNDVIVQTGGSNHYDLISGENEQGNLAQIFNGSFHYDLIIVAGAYHGMNVIFQNNILLDNDAVTQLAKGDEQTQSLAAGQNELLNAATIETFGNDNFLPLTPGLESLVAALANGIPGLDPETGTLLPGTGGTFEVLYITGDYYDINAVWQTNVVSDVDVLLQLLERPSDAAQQLHPGDDGAQVASTGANMLTNDAAIVDVGPTDAYVGGQVYGDTILVQANLLPTDADPALARDTQTLVSELVAFVTDAQDEEQQAPPAPPPPPCDDAISNVMH
ncbi:MULTISPECIES: hypothetical protein [unclassified Bradyrhizobium]|uniref:hypothetical protein n=1 Tax=unclassified Bradyrhizobium TaxID=2631580 RepID=UPI000709C5DD|nr:MULTISPECIES: hypothetical protein [unclassified Bradyrhizobium]KQT15852.1 hypothetical protein ASG57_05880 [Bradyrhizobium sp. Leaf396]